MIIVNAKPPMYDEIATAFGLTPEKLADVKPIFAWGDRIYQPFSTAPLDKSLIAHERVHGVRQMAMIVPSADIVTAPLGATEALPLRKEADPDVQERIEGWWRNYIVDPEFRLLEEVLAHRAELDAVIDDGRKVTRNWRRVCVVHVAKRLCGPLYNWPVGLINIPKAMRLLKLKEYP